MHPDTLAPSAQTELRRSRGVTIGVGGAAVLLGAIDAYVVVSILLQMAQDLDIAANHVQKILPLVTGYLLAYVAGMPLLGGLSDRFGRRLVIQISLAGFLVGSLVTAIATDLPTLIAGRALQGLAGGALLPVTMALVGDLWDEHRRPTILGWIGAAQELGTVLGPLYGAGLAALITWRGIFWVNIPLTIIAMIAVHFALPAHIGSQNRRKVDLVGGLLLATASALLVVGLYNPEPEVSVLPPNGKELTIAGGVVFVLFLFWEWLARTKLIDLTNARKVSYFAALLANFVAGAALMVTLVDVVVVARTLLGKTDAEASILLARFLFALPVGAILGGVIARRIAERWVNFVGFLVAAFAYWLISGWPADVLTSKHDILGLAVPRMDLDLAIAGLGLGLVIAPLSSAALRATPPQEHGVASATLVVARTLGMLIGVAAVTGWGLNQFYTLTADLQMPPLPANLTDPVVAAAYQAEIAVYQAAINAELLAMYHKIFLVTAVLCVVGALVGLLLSRREAVAPPAPPQA